MLYFVLFLYNLFVVLAYQVHDSNANGSWYKVKALTRGRVDLSFVVQGITVVSLLLVFTFVTLY